MILYYIMILAYSIYITFCSPEWAGSPAPYTYIMVKYYEGIPYEGTYVCMIFKLYVTDDFLWWRRYLLIAIRPDFMVRNLKTRRGP